MANPESKIGWLSPSAINRPENIITDAYGNEVQLTPEELETIKHFTEESSIEKLMAWGGFKTIEEAEAFLAESEQAS